MKDFSRWRPHPWHGLEIGEDPPRVVNAYIEITPFDLVKYEVDKVTGYLRVDRPQRTSSSAADAVRLHPAHVLRDARRGARRRAPMRGDGDPLDICVVSERPITKSEYHRSAPSSSVGFSMIDRGEADDKIIAVLRSDDVWGECHATSRTCRRSSSNGSSTTSRTYKIVPHQEPTIQMQGIYGFEHASRVLEAALADYAEFFQE